MHYNTYTNPQLHLMILQIDISSKYFGYLRLILLT